MPPEARSRRSPDPARTTAWNQAAPAPVVAVRGSETALADRAVGRIVAAIREREPNLRPERLDAAACVGGELADLTSPTLFGGDRCLIVEGVAEAGDAFLDEALRYLADPAPELTVVLRHSGGPRGRKLLDGVAAAGFPVVACDPVKRDQDKADLVGAEFRAAGRKIDPGAVRALVDATGNDLAELFAACAQLISDTAGPVTVAEVRRYHGGRVEATGFAVADAAVEGRRAEAIRLVRHALATGVDPVPIVATLALKLRTMVKVEAARGRGLDAARDLGLASWQVDQARRALRGWTPEGLAAAITAVADADAETKGEGKDARFAVERAVLRITVARG